MSGIKERLNVVFQGFLAAANGFGRMAAWALISLALLVVIAVVFNPAKFGSYLWIVSKLSLAAVLGYCYDRAAFPDERPSQLDGLEKSMAQTRRNMLMAACIVAAGLMP